MIALILLPLFYLTLMAIIDALQVKVITLDLPPVTLPVIAEIVIPVEDIPDYLKRYPVFSQKPDIQDTEPYPVATFTSASFELKQATGNVISIQGKICK